MLRGPLDSRELPIYVYLNDIVIYEDAQEQVLSETLKVICQLIGAGFMIQLVKFQLVVASAKVLNH